MKKHILPPDFTPLYSYVNEDNRYVLVAFDERTNDIRRFYFGERPIPEGWTIDNIYHRHLKKL